MIKRFFVAIIHKKNLQLTAHLLIFESKTAFSLAKSETSIFRIFNP